MSGLVALVLASLSIVDASCSRRSQRRPDRSAEGAAAPAPGLKVEDLVVGSGDAATVGKTVSIHYTGWLNGAKFDTSLNRKPLMFRLGKGEVLRGWDLGVAGMKVGGKRKLTLPPELGYGHKGSLGGAIPPDSVLVFDIDLVSVRG
jgi:FKBP-type peptidyl-prolyl cis-trans isomerase